MNGVPRDVYFDHDYEEGDVAYLRANPEIVPKGYVKLSMYWDEKDQTLMAREVCDDAGPQKYRVDKWCWDFLDEPPNCGIIELEQDAEK